MNDFFSEIINEIEKVAKSIGRKINIMEVCGGHTNTIMRYGIRDVLPKNIKLISGPGCPVCVTSQKDIDSMIEIALNKIPIATYGDMIRVPGSKKSLEEARSEGAIIETIYSTSEVIELKKRYESIVFFGIGFETTTPMTAFLLKNKIPVFSVHKLIPPAMNLLIEGEIKIDGYIAPGHVSTILGVKNLKSINAPQVIAGFKPEQILKSIYLLLLMIKDNKKGIINGYPEIVKYEGNKKAQKLVEECFKVTDSEWRGIGTIPKSGLDVKEDKLNAKLIYKNIIDKVKPTLKTGCQCGLIIKGIKEPKDCPLFKKVCTPENPKGACMVSEEGSCQISFNYS